MPTLVRLLTTLLVIAGLLYGIMAALVYFVEPTRRETIVEIPLPLKPAPPAGQTGAAEPGADAGFAAPAEAANP